MAETATTLTDVDAVVVTGAGRRMHLAQVLYHGSGDRDANTLCGRFLMSVHQWPLDEEADLPWDLCRRCSDRREQDGRSGDPS